MYQPISRAHAGPLRRNWPRSEGVWLALVTFLGLVHLFIVFIGAGLENDPRAQLFDWPAIGSIGLLGLIGIWLADLTGFPAAWSADISNRRRLVLPLAIGASLGLVEIGNDLVFHWTQLFASTHELTAFNAPWPGSPLFYTGGAVIVEVLYRLLPIPLVLWLVSTLVLRGRARSEVFWALAVLTSLIEPSTQALPELGAAGVSAAAVAVSFAIGFGENMTQAVFFRQYGVVAAILVRVGMYMVWHVAYGNFVCRC